MTDHGFDSLMRLAVRDGVNEGAFDLDLQLIGGNRGLLPEDFEVVGPIQIGKQGPLGAAAADGGDHDRVGGDPGGRGVDEPNQKRRDAA